MDAIRLTGFTGRRLIHRPFDLLKDAEPYRHITNDPEVIRLADRTRPIKPEEHLLWCTNMAHANTTFFRAVDYTLDANTPPVFAGAIWLYDIDWRHRTAEVRIILGPAKHLDHGIGTWAIRSIRDAAWGDLKLDKLYAYVLEINPRAKRAFERAGFALEAVLKRDRVADGKRVDVWRLAAHREENA